MYPVTRTRKKLYTICVFFIYGVFYHFQSEVSAKYRSLCHSIKVILKEEGITAFWWVNSQFVFWFVTCLSSTLWQEGFCSRRSLIHYLWRCTGDRHKSSLTLPFMFISLQFGTFEQTRKCIRMLVPAQGAAMTPSEWKVLHVHLFNIYPARMRKG